MTFPESAPLLDPVTPEEFSATLLADVGFADLPAASQRFQALAETDAERESLAQCLPALLVALSDAAVPDNSLVNFERFLQSIDDRLAQFQYLAENPRAVEILVKLFVGSQFLTEILLRNPNYLKQLTEHKGLAEFKSRQQFLEEATEAAGEADALAAKLDALRRFQHWELLRIGACDAFRLFDLKAATVQLSLLADSLVECCIQLLAAELDVDPGGFVVLAFGKLGGEEINYSSDIDLVFLADRDAPRFWPLGQRLIKALTNATGEGFMYRVDMRLRPWGASGALVNTVDAHLDYLGKHGRAWEKQALLKARAIAGDMSVGRDFLERVKPLMFGVPLDEARDSVRGMKAKIEAALEKQGRTWGEVKAGPGSIRDVEFTTQFLQLAHGGEHRHVQSFNTLDALVRLADHGLIHADEYRRLSSGYVFLRTIEHALQLMHHKQTHSLPESKREQTWLARRLDFPDAAAFLTHYERHRTSIRAIYQKYLEGAETESDESTDEDPHTLRMEPAYARTFDPDEIKRHGQLLERLSNENLVEIDASAEGDGWRVTIVGVDLSGDLSIICGLFFALGFDIQHGQVFTEAYFGAKRKSGKKLRRFVNVFHVRSTQDSPPAEIWKQYETELRELMRQASEEGSAAAQGKLAKRVAAAVAEMPGIDSTLLPVTVEIENDDSSPYTMLHIRGTDTVGFMYELSNALTTAGIDICRVIIGGDPERQAVQNVLYVTEESAAKITSSERLQQLRAAIVLIKNFTHLLPQSPNPETALLQFREFLEAIFQREDWHDELSPVNNSKVLHTLSRLLGVSNFLWEDFLRLQHENLFPVLTDIEKLSHRKSVEEFAGELNSDIAEAEGSDARRSALNAFKDREMFRTDLRHITGKITEFGAFSRELTDLADVVVRGATQLCLDELTEKHGTPTLDDGGTCRLSVCALGKCGGRELGFASDIELMFLYEGEGRTGGNVSITNAEFFQKLVEEFRKAIQARQEGIFQVDLRLRPYGRAGSLAVARDAFRKYFSPDGAAWPYERQALVKLRPVAGDAAFGEEVVALRDELVYRGERFDVAAMRGMREKQIIQLVEARSINAKLSAGGLVDCEYVVQGLQITHGHKSPAVRATNTRAAMAALADAGYISKIDHDELREAYIFLRRLIDALRVVRGNAKDLTVPPHNTEEFVFLARRLGYGPERLARRLERTMNCIQELGRLLDG